MWRKGREKGGKEQVCWIDGGEKIGRAGCWKQSIKDDRDTERKPNKQVKMYKVWSR